MSKQLEQLDSIMDLTRQLGDQLESSDQLEEITDILIDELLRVLPIPWFLGFIRKPIRKALDNWLPGGLFEAIGSAVQLARRQLLGRRTA